MDPGLAYRFEEFRQQQAAHEGDSVLYSKLVSAAMDVNEVCMQVREDADRLGLIMGQAMLDIGRHYEAQRITKEQCRRLLELLKDGVEEPTVDNDIPVYKMPFPSPDYRPPAA